MMRVEGLPKVDAGKVMVGRALFGPESGRKHTIMLLRLS